MMRDLDDLAVPKVRHIPLAPPRKGTPGEGIYLELWREWATARPAEWHQIFRTIGPVRQRAASVAASFMVYMGCNGGHSFTYQAERLAEADVFKHSREAAFLAAWALDNRRSAGVNSGLRTSEYMLAAQHPITQGFRGGRVDWKKVPNITQDDNDILESMVIWWSSGPAAVVRSIAEPMIEAANRKAWSKMFQAEGGAA